MLGQQAGSGESEMVEQIQQMLTMRVSSGGEQEGEEDMSWFRVEEGGMAADVGEA